MTRKVLEPIDPKLDALLDAERRAPAPPATLARVWSRLDLGPKPGGGGGDGGSGAAQGWVGSHAAALATGTFLVGVVTGAAGYAALRAPPPPRVIYVDRPAPPASAVATAETPAPPRDTTALPKADHLAPRLVPSAASPSTLSAERALLDDARAALGQEQPARALSLLDEHEHRFPKAQLQEEREALAVQALVMLKRYDEARARAARFTAAAPNSLFRPVIDASLAGIP